MNVETRKRRKRPAKSSPVWPAARGGALFKRPVSLEARRRLKAAVPSTRRKGAHEARPYIPKQCTVLSYFFNHASVTSVKSVNTPSILAS